MRPARSTESSGAARGHGFGEVRRKVTMARGQDEPPADRRSGWSAAAAHPTPHSDDSHGTGDLPRRVMPSRWTFGETGLIAHATRTGHTHGGNDIFNADLDCDGAGR